VRVWVDKGYQGIEEVVPEDWVIEQPKKQPRGGELSESEQATNREVNAVRIQVEHGIGRLKRYGVLGGVYRGRLEGYAEVMEVAG
jgi:hypothetical protein